MVLLFDIDGTLLQSHGVGRRAVEHSLQSHFGRPFDTQSITFSGKTDPQIFREILSDSSIAGDVELDLDVAVRQACEAYARRMHATWEDATVEALPGAVELVEQLGARGEPLGLLTGNLEPMAHLKVGRIGLGNAFAFGAYGSDDEHRNALPLVALERARGLFDRPLASEDLVLIGDTPRDIEAAQAVGALSVGVATGRYSADDLRAADASIVLDTLLDFDIDALTALHGQAR